MPANTSIILAFLLMQRDPAVFGEDALEFRLERWLDGSIGESERLAFMSWNFGPRMVSLLRGQLFRLVPPACSARLCEQQTGYQLGLDEIFETPSHGG